MATEKICISYARNERNEPHIIALLIKIQDLVQNVSNVLDTIHVYILVVDNVLCVHNAH